MPTTSRAGVEIYYETEGRGPALVMLHGFFGSSQDWREYGYVAAFSGLFKVIVIDLRGHGRSGKPKQPTAYKVVDYAQDVRQVLQALAVGQFHFMGFSIGARVGFRLSSISDLKMLSFVCIGGHPFHESMGTTKQGTIDLDKWVPESGLSKQHQERLISNDRAALIAAAEFDLEEEPTENVTMPTLVVAGELDEDYQNFLRVGDMLPRAKVLSIAKVNHVESLTKSGLCIPGIADFLRKAREL
jgi:pimeloyl-ACP methyl ester carboxylesterase